MTFWITEIKATDPITGIECRWAGPLIPGDTMQMAECYLKWLGMGYCKVIGKYVGTVDFKDTFMPLELNENQKN